MKYTDSAFERAEKEMTRRRSAAESEHQNRLNEINARLPEIAVLEEKQRKAASSLGKIVLSGAENAAEQIDTVRQENLRVQRTIEDMLESYNGDRHYLDVPYTCEVCKDRGFSGGKRCDCMKKLLEKYTIEEVSSGCHIKLHDFTEFRLDCYPTQPMPENGIVPFDRMSEALSYCKDYAESFPQSKASLLFIGKTGLGKTFLSSCIAKTVVEKGYTVLFGSISDFLRMVENEHFGRAEGDTMSALLECDLLILDDLGSEFKTPFNEAALYGIINGRINTERPTIVSTNLSPKELNNTYNERIISRLTGCTTPFQFFGRDIRSSSWAKANT